MQRRRARPNEVVGRERRPRFERFSAAMAHARATGAPELGLYDGEPAPYDGQPADVVQPARPVDRPAAHDDRPGADYDQPSADYERSGASYEQRRAYHESTADEDRFTAPDDRFAAYEDQFPPEDQLTAPEDRFAADEDPFPHDDRFPADEDRFPAYNGQPAGFYSPVPRPALRPVARRSLGARAWAVLRWLGIAGCVLVVCLLIAVWLAWPESARLLSRWLAA